MTGAIGNRRAKIKHNKVLNAKSPGGGFCGDVTYVFVYRNNNKTAVDGQVVLCVLCPAFMPAYFF